MATLEKNKELIVSNNSNSKGGVDYVIKNTYNNAEVKLGDVFNYLPAGVIDKTETGIGGTSCEINSERNSIIVQPYSTTAYNKARFKPQHQKNNVHFFGRSKFRFKTPPGGSNGKVRTVVILGLNNEEKEYDLNSYLDSLEPGTPIKITCVTDQLTPLKTMMEAYKPGLFSSCHLVLDEIDCFQEHSNFRPVMDKCIEIYKDHPQDKRSLISATIKEFIDPILKDEPLTTVRYQTKNLSNLNVIATSYDDQECYQQLCIIAQKYKGQKVVVALNHILDCIAITTALKKNPLFNSSTIRILCSESSAKQVDDLFDVLSEDGMLPADINFVTSAYFNGVDINEKYHSVIVASGVISTLRLSSSLIYQISGRCRLGLFSNTVIVNINQESGYKTYSVDDLKVQASEQTTIYNAISVLKNSIYTNTVDLINLISDMFDNGYKSFFSLCYINDDQQCLVSFLKIESRLEQQLTFQSYKSTYTFTKELSKRFLLQRINPIYKNGNPKFVVYDDVKTEGLRILNKLISLKPKEKIDQLKSQTPVFNKKLMCLFEIFEAARNVKNVDYAKLEKLIHEELNATRVNLEPILVNLEFHATISPFPTSKLNKLFTKHLVIGKEYSIDDLKHACTDLVEVIDSFKKAPEKSNKLKSLLIAHPNLIRQGILNVDEKGGRQRTLTIVNYNKYDIFL